MTEEQKKPNVPTPFPALLQFVIAMSTLAVVVGVIVGARLGLEKRKGGRAHPHGEEGIAIVVVTLLLGVLVLMSVLIYRSVTERERT